ncbi:NADP-dependent oxidoreductase domain-containing protein [Dipodascopsis tothii]|uniref:NADP-dependent oxidoreductase domain-containing protein n=1 Tax=Dipodascopsis tothii TaxID=44089 RepID=UPI0034CDA94A
MVGTSTVFHLTGGLALPAVGLGTSDATDPAAIKKAIELGYRHIDTAFFYKNEAEVGQAIRESGVPREQLVVTTKVWGTYHSRVAEALELSLANLGLDYVDLYLMHWPVPLNPKGTPADWPVRADGSADVEKDWDFVKTWAAMQELVAQKKVRAIGVCNFSTVNLEKLLAAPTTTIVPAVNQVELHPYLPQRKLLEYCSAKGIVLTAYSPLGSTDAPLLAEPVIVDIAARLGKTPAQVALSWAVTRGIAVIPKSVNAARQLNNLDDFVMAPADVAAIDAISLTKKLRVITPDFGEELFHDDD